MQTLTISDKRKREIAIDSIAQGRTDSDILSLFIDKYGLTVPYATVRGWRRQYRQSIAATTQQQQETTQQQNGAISVTQHETTLAETTQQQHGAISVTHNATTQQHNATTQQHNATTQQHNATTQQHNALEVTLNVQNNTVQPSNNIEQQHTTTQPSLSHTQKMMIGLLLCTSLSNMALTVASFQFILGNVFAGWGTGSVLALMPAALCFYRFQHPHGYYHGFDNSKMLLYLCFFAEVIGIALHTFTSIDPSTTNAVATLTYGYVGKTGFVWAIASVLPSINIFTAGVFIGTCNNQE